MIVIFVYFPNTKTFLIKTVIVTFKPGDISGPIRFMRSQRQKTKFYSTYSVKVAIYQPYKTYLASQILKYF